MIDTPALEMATKEPWTLLCKNVQELAEELLYYRTNEDQTSISAWAEETFGECGWRKAWERCCQEIGEADLCVVEGTATAAEFVSELADIYITMVRVADILGYDLQYAVNQKMKVNRERVWVVHDGVGQHV